MFNINSIWFEVSVVTFFFLFGNIFFGHFEERSPNWRKLAKYFVTLAAIVLISVTFGRPVALAILGLMVIPVLFIHGYVLPKKGINGWTGEPKWKYYEFRGWSKDIFSKKKKR